VGFLHTLHVTALHIPYRVYVSAPNPVTLAQAEVLSWAHGLPATYRTGVAVIKEESPARTGPPPTLPTKRHGTPLLLGVLGLCATVGIVTLATQAALMWTPNLLPHWYGWLPIVAIAGAVAWVVRRRLRAIGHGMLVGAALLLVGVGMLGAAQVSWRYRMTPTHPAVDRHPVLDIVFAGRWWTTPAGEAQALEEEQAFRVYRDSGWWSLLGRYGVGEFTIGGCRIATSVATGVTPTALAEHALRGPAAPCPDVPSTSLAAPSGVNGPMLVLFGSPDAFLSQHLFESGWNALLHLPTGLVRAAFVLYGSLKIAPGLHGLVGVTPIEDTTLTLSHELAEGITSLGPGSIRVAASPVDRFLLVAGASVIYALTAQWGNIVPFYQSQPTDVLQVADACSPGQPAFAPSPATSWRFVDGIGMVSLLSPSGTRCLNISTGQRIAFPAH